jgi:hypothetical protein
LFAERPAASFSSDEELQLLYARLLIKAADLSHVHQPYAEAAEWDRKIHKEFYEQGDLEVSLGFVPPALFLRDENDPAKSDHWFYKNMALPIMEVLAAIVPNPGSAVAERVCVPFTDSLAPPSPTRTTLHTISLLQSECMFYIGVCSRKGSVCACVCVGGGYWLLTFV